MEWVATSGASESVATSQKPLVEMREVDNHAEAVAFADELAPCVRQAGAYIWEG